MLLGALFRRGRRLPPRSIPIGVAAGAILVAAVASASAAPFGPRTATHLHSSARRTSVQPNEGISGTGRLYVFIDQTLAGTAMAYEGCAAIGVVDTQANGNSEAKSVSAARLETCQIKMGLAMTLSMKSWLRAGLLGKNAVRQVSILRVDANGNPAAAVTLVDASLIGLTLSPLNAATMGTVSLTITLTAADEVRSNGAQLVNWVALPRGAYYQNLFTLSLRDALQPGVINVSSVSLTRRLDGDRFTPWDVKDLTIQMSRSQGASWDAWYQAQVVDRSDDERVIRLALLRLDGSTSALFTLGGVGVFETDPNLDSSDGTSAARRTFRAYVETVDMQLY